MAGEIISERDVDSRFLSARDKMLQLSYLPITYHETPYQIIAAANDARFVQDLYFKDDVVQSLVGILRYFPYSHLESQDLKTLYATGITASLEQAIEQGLAHSAATALIKILESTPRLLSRFPVEFSSKLRWLKINLRSFETKIYSTEPDYFPEEIIPAPGMEGTWRWLKDLRLHKYWPIFSRWTYDEMLAVNEENIDLHVRNVRGQPITKGARGKILRCIADLTLRSTKLMDMRRKVENRTSSLDQLILLTTEILRTPLKRTTIKKTAQDLPDLLLNTITFVYEEVMWMKKCPHMLYIQMKIVLTKALKCLAFTYKEKNIIRLWIRELDLRYLSIIWPDFKNGVCHWEPTFISDKKEPRYINAIQTTGSREMSPQSGVCSPSTSFKNGRCF